MSYLSSGWLKLTWVFFVVDRNSAMCVCHLHQRIVQLFCLLQKWTHARHVVDSNHNLLPCSSASRTVLCVLSGGCDSNIWSYWTQWYFSWKCKQCHWCIICIAVLTVGDCSKKVMLICHDISHLSTAWIATLWLLLFHVCCGLPVTGLQLYCFFSFCFLFVAELHDKHHERHHWRPWSRKVDEATGLPETLGWWLGRKDMCN